MYKVSIVIVTYNGMQWIEKCLNSCRGYNIIVIDNNSKKEDLEKINQLIISTVENKTGAKIRS